MKVRLRGMEFTGGVGIRMILFSLGWNRALALAKKGNHLLSRSLSEFKNNSGKVNSIIVEHDWKELKNVYIHEKAAQTETLLTNIRFRPTPRVVVEFAGTNNYLKTFPSLKFPVWLQDEKRERRIPKNLDNVSCLGFSR